MGGGRERKREKKREWLLFCDVNKSSSSVLTNGPRVMTWFSADVRIFRAALRFSFDAPVSALRSEGPERGNVMEHWLPTAAGPCTALILLPPWALSGFPG